MRCEFEIIFDLLAEGVEPVVAQGKPELQRTEAGGQFQCLVEKCEAFNRVFEQRLRIVARERKCLARCVTISIEQATAIKGLIKPLVWVERNGVCQFHSSE